MPEISRFYGIVIKMYYSDHAPPHFHAEYGEQELIVGIAPITILAGSAPPRVRSMVLEWAALNQQALQQNWDRCRHAQPPESVTPLE
jgi:hypothetical protein